MHIYDRGTDPTPKYQGACDGINDRGDKSVAFLTIRGEMENYIPPAAIKTALGVDVAFGPTDDVPAIVTRAVHEAAPDGGTWDELSHDAVGKKERRAKYRLNREAAALATADMLAYLGVKDEILRWLRAIGQALAPTSAPVAAGTKVIEIASRVAETETPAAQ